MSGNTVDIDDYIAGDSLTLNVTVIDDNGSARDITNASIEWVVKDDNKSETAFTKDTSSGISIVDGGAGEFRIVVQPADTQSLQGRYRHECEVTLPSGESGTVLYGDFIISDSLID